MRVFSSSDKVPERERSDQVLLILNEIGGDREFVKQGRIGSAVRKRTGRELYDFNGRIPYSSELDGDLWDMMSEGYLKMNISDYSFMLDRIGMARVRELQSFGQGGEA